MDAEERERALETAILAYLAEHPRATDSLVGIAEWWLMRQRVRSETEALERVLQGLIDRGVLERVGTGAAARYRLTRPSQPAP